MNDDGVSYEKSVLKELGPEEGPEPQPAVCDDGVLHFDPEKELERDLLRDDSRPNSRASPSKSKPGKLKLIQVINNKHTSNDKATSPSRKTAARLGEAKATPRRKRKGKEREDVDNADAGKSPMTDQEVFDSLKGLILADKPLYMRVLRYEVSLLRYLPMLFSLTPRSQYILMPSSKLLPKTASMH